MSSFKIIKADSLVIDYDLDKVRKFIQSNPHQKVALEFKNTTYLSNKIIDKIKRSGIPNLHIRIAGGYDDEMYRRYKRDFIVDDPIYSIKETEEIYAKILEIESKMNPSWNSEEKFFFFVGYLSSNITYHPEHETQPSRDIRSLRGLTSGFTVCAGYSLMLKELCDRNGIPCDIAVGATKTEEIGQTTHVWNIVHFNGKNIPIDLTWDSGSRKRGELTDIYNLANVQDFIERHFPNEKEPLQDYKRTLTGLSGGYVSSIYRRIIKDNNIVVEFERNEGKYSLALCGQQIHNGKPIWKYLLIKRDKNNNIVDMQVLCVGSNILKAKKGYQLLQKLKRQLGEARKQKNQKEIERLEKEMEPLKKYDDAYANVKTLLLSEKNIERARRTNSGYLGEIKIGNDKKYHVIINGEYENKKFFNQRTFTRSDGTKFVLVQNGVIKTPVGTLNRYRILEPFGKGSEVRRNTVYSEDDLMKYTDQRVIDDFFSRSRIDRKKKETSGYLGYYRNNIRYSSAQFNQYFETVFSKEFKISDKYFVKYQQPLTFDQMKKFALAYEMVFNGKVVDRKTKKEITDPKLKLQIQMSCLWRSVAGIKLYAPGFEPLPGYNYAFNEGSEKCFEFINKCIKDSLKESGNINPKEVLRMVDQNVHYKHAYDIVMRLFRTPYQIQMINNFYRMQNPSIYLPFKADDLSVAPIVSLLDVVPPKKNETEIVMENGEVTFKRM